MFHKLWDKCLRPTLCVTYLNFLSTAKSSSFVESCHFEEDNICGMIQGPGNRKWERHSSVTAGPQTDFSNMGQCQGDYLYTSTYCVGSYFKTFKYSLSELPSSGQGSSSSITLHY